MKIALISPYADPEVGAAVVRVNALRDAFQGAGHRVEVFSPARGGVHAAGVARYRGIRELLSLLASSRCDVVIGTSPPITHNVFAALACRARGIPFVLDAKDPFSFLAERAAYLPKSRCKLFLYRAMETACYGLASHLFVLTPRDKRLLESDGVPAAKVTVIRNGADTAVVRFDPRQRQLVRKHLRIPPKSKVVVYAGVVGGKSLDTLLRACRTVVERHRAYLLFLLTHDGSAHAERMHQSLLAALAGLSLDRRSRVVVNTPYRQLYAYLSAGDVALNPIPSFWDTNLPTKVFDYLAAELPVVSKGPAEGSMRDFHRAHGGGFFATTWEGAARQLDKALKDPSRRTKGRAGRQAIERHFSRLRSAREALQVLERLV